MKQLFDFLGQEYILLILLATFIILILIYALGRIRQSNTKKLLKELEVLFTTNKSVPLAFKLNKALALAKTNDNLIEPISEAKAKYDEIEKDFKTVSIMLADIEDAIIIGKPKQASLWYEDAKLALEKIEVEVGALEDQLNHILEDEVEQRSLITQLKDEFRVIKTKITNQKSIYAHSMDTINDQVSGIENMFTSFEEWMYASEFEKAKAKSEEIDGGIKSLDRLLNELPELINLTKGMLPTLIDEVATKYTQAKGRNLHVDHLDVERNLDMISQTLKDDLTQLRNGVVTEVKEHCLESEKRLLQLKNALEHESRAFDEADQLLNQLETNLIEVNQYYESLDQKHSYSMQRYGLHSLQPLLDEKQAEIRNSEAKYQDLKNTFEQQALPISSIIADLKDEVLQVQQLKQTLHQEYTKVNQAQSDEERAKKQLLKLHLIVNEIQVKIRKHRLPTISDSYSGDVSKAKQMTHMIEQLLETEPLDVSRLNTFVNESIDFIYKLYNNVNNIVGMVDMVENGIVFANKYRSSIEFVDHELTRSELSFRNGEYTQALSIVLAAIEKLHPDTFEELIRENAKSATSRG